MATKSLTDYERKRLENIKRNDELLASLNIKSKLSDLSASSKRHRCSPSSCHDSTHAHYQAFSHKLPSMAAPNVENGELVLLNNNYTRADISIPAKRGRGRPPKAKDPAAESLVPAQVKRGRGRPKKDPNAPPSEKKVKGATAPPPPSKTGHVMVRRSSRPRKVQPELTGVEAN